MINQRQFSQLSEMGITLYQSRTNNEASTKPESDYMSVNAEDIINDPFFADVLTSLAISLGEISINEKYLDLGLFNWRFHEETSIEVKDSLLITPEIAQIKQSSSLKKALWNALYTHLL